MSTTAFTIGDTVRIGKGKALYTVRGEVRSDGQVWLTYTDANGFHTNRYVDATRIERIAS